MTDNELIDALGGTRTTSKLVGLTESAISCWRKRGIPKSWLEYLRLKKPKLFKQT